MSRSRKERKLNQSQALVSNETPFQVLWKGAQTTPNEELKRLSQFAGAYASATIDRAT